MQSTPPVFVTCVDVTAQETDKTRLYVVVYMYTAMGY